MDEPLDLLHAMVYDQPGAQVWIRTRMSSFVICVGCDGIVVVVVAVVVAVVRLSVDVDFFRFWQHSSMLFATESITRRYKARQPQFSFSLSAHAPQFKVSAQSQNYSRRAILRAQSQRW